MSDEPCRHDWWAPRHDVPTSVDVHHVCTRGAGHSGEWRLRDYRDPGHRCACGAMD